MDTLTSAARRELRARAHHLRPVVAIGHHGLTPAVLHEIDVALNAHELVKLRVLDDDRDARERLLAKICGDLGCAPVQHLGKLLIVWRERRVAEPAKAQEAARRRGAFPAVPTGAARRRTLDPVASAETVRAVRPRTGPSERRAPAGVARAALRRRRRG